METITEAEKKASWNDYMKKYYEANKEKQKTRNRFYKQKTKSDITEPLKEKYGIYVADILKIKKLVNNLPSDLLTKCLNDIIPQIATM